MTQSEACFCGVNSAAICVRCGEPRCAQHYHLAVWHDSLNHGGWAAQLPIGNQSQAWLNGSDEHINSYAVYPKAYAAGGPGCVNCRKGAAEQAVAAVHEACASFAAQPSSGALKVIAEGADVITDEELRMIAEGLRGCAPATASLVQLQMSPPPTKTFGKGYKTTDATVSEVWRRPVAWFPQQHVAIDESHKIWLAMRSRRLSHFLERPKLDGSNPICVLASNEAGRARFAEGSVGGWGNDSTPDRYELTVGMPMAELRSVAGIDYQYQYVGTLSGALGDLADALR